MFYVFCGLKFGIKYLDSLDVHADIEIQIHCHTIVKDEETWFRKRRVKVLSSNEFLACFDNLLLMSTVPYH